MPMFITMSTSSAPASTASLVSAAFAVLRHAPSGKPTTQHTFVSVPLSAAAAIGT